MWHKRAPFYSQARPKDEVKRIECNKHGITFIEVPFWWDGSKESLKATLLKQRQFMQINE